MADSALIRETRRQIQRAPICEPVGDEYKAPCHWSRTGWAVCTKDGCCTCQPTTPPVSSQENT